MNTPPPPDRPIRRVLVTGFEPFGTSDRNPSLELALALDGSTIEGDEHDPPATMHARVLPVVGGAAPAYLRRAWREVQPDAVVLFGESGRATAITFERLAVNRRDYGIADNGGACTSNEALEPAGPVARASTLPIDAMCTAARAAGVPAVDSLSAGTFLCNETLWAALAFAESDAPRTPVGFIHVPRLPEQVVDARRPGPSMGIETTHRGALAALRELVAWSHARTREA